MSTLHIKRRRHALIVTVILLAGVAMITQTGWVTSLELKTVDARSRWFRNQHAAPSDILLILIDEASLETMQPMFGRWPWPRSVLADAIDFLSNCGSKAVLMDILFTERQLVNSQTNGLAEDDQALVASTRNATNVYHSMQFSQDREDEYNQSLLNRPLPAEFIKRFSLPKNSMQVFTTANRYYLPFKELYQAAAGIGVVSVTPDPDGVFRRVPLLVQYNHHLFPALSLAPLLEKNKPGLTGSGSAAALLSGKTAPRRLPLDSKGQFHINMYGKFDAYSFGGLYLTLLKIRQGILSDLPISPEIFNGKIVFIGASAAGVEDLKLTALGPRTPGVFLHASAYGNIIADDTLRFAPEFFQSIMMVIMVLLAVAAVFFLERLFAKILAPLSAAMLWGGLALFLFSRNISLPLAGPFLAALCAYVISLSVLSFSEGRERRKIKNVLGQYVAPAVLLKVLDNSKEEFMRAEIGSKEELSIFFSDIRGFTTLAETYPVEKVVELLNGYLSAMTDIIFDTQGTLDKFIGDAIVAFWGAPLRDDTHPLKAVQAALKMQQSLADLNLKNSARDLPQLNVGIGIHTDHVILGNIGSHRKLDYTVIGDGVNLTSRLEGLTKMYNTPILISQSTYERVATHICCRVVDYVKVKGKQKPIRIYAALGAPEELAPESAEIITLADSAFTCYTRKEFSRAEDILNKILTIKSNDFLANMLLYRCREYQQNPPPETWDGYYQYYTK